MTELTWLTGLATKLAVDDGLGESGVSAAGLPNLMWLRLLGESGVGTVETEADYWTYLTW